jgi:hypothetical protein
MICAILHFDGEADETLGVGLVRLLSGPNMCIADIYYLRFPCSDSSFPSRVFPNSPLR